MKLFALSIRTPLFQLAVIRIAIGLTFLTHAADKIIGLTEGGKSWMLESPLKNIMDGSLNNAAVPDFYHNFERMLVLANLPLFTYLVILGELCVGVSLVLGLFTRLGAGVAMFLSLNYALMKGLRTPVGDIDHVFLACELMVLLANAGMVWGVDGAVYSSAPSRGPRTAPASPRPARAG